MKKDLESNKKKLAIELTKTIYGNYRAANIGRIVTGNIFFYFFTAATYFKHVRHKNWHEKQLQKNQELYPNTNVLTGHEQRVEFTYNIFIFFLSISLIYSIYTLYKILQNKKYES